MDKLFLIIIISSAIILCLLIINFINDKKEKFLNHGGFFTYNNKNNKNNKINLDCADNLKINQGEKYSFSYEELNKIKIVSNKVISKINKDLNLNFKFTEIDYLTKQEFGDGNIRYLIEIFINEYKHLYNRRIMLDIFIDSKNKTININKITILNSKKDTSNQLKIEPQKFSKKILGFNDDNINIQGFNNSNLEFNILAYKPKNFNNKNFTEWILPNQYKNALNNTIKYENNNQWDQDGIMKNNVKNFKNNIPKFLPNFKNINANSNLNWLFGLYKTDGRNMFMGGRGHGSN